LELASVSGTVWVEDDHTGRRKQLGEEDTPFFVKQFPRDGDISGWRALAAA
jgi:hypothetical protein